MKKILQSQDIQIIAFSSDPAFQLPDGEMGGCGPVTVVPAGIGHPEYCRLLQSGNTEYVMMVNADRFPLVSWGRLVREFIGEERRQGIFYLAPAGRKNWLGIVDARLVGSDRDIQETPVLIGERRWFLEAYGGEDLNADLLRAVGYSLTKTTAPLYRLESELPWEKAEKQPSLLKKYGMGLPARFLFSGKFFTTLRRDEYRTPREMVYRLLMLLFAVFTVIWMPAVSNDFGISGDEFVDHHHSELVLDYFTKGDKAALDQPKTTLHLYGNALQVVAAAVTRVTGVEDVYCVRHLICALVGAGGIILCGLLGLRFGGGLCGLLAMVLLFFSPRFLGHSMNNLKDIPFAVGYLMAIYYFIRMFDRYPVVKLRHVIGAVAGIFLALGTRSGGLLLYPYLLMYAGLFYILWVGWKSFLKLGKHRKEIENMLTVVLLVAIAGYLLSILLWPFALSKPLVNVVVSLREFTNYSLGLRTLFEGRQVMSNMLPMHYAPKYLAIASPLVVVLGLGGYLVSLIFCRKSFTLPAFFLLFALIFPVFWVIYKQSNLYGGIRHLLFVMPLMVVLAARFWSGLLQLPSRIVKWVALAVFAGLLFLPIRHTARNHPNEYVYFNELVGGLRGAYGDYETDYYYNSLKNAVDWFKKHVDYSGRKIVIVTNHSNNLQQYFRGDTNVRVLYSRYYEKFEKEWDYMIFGNVYINGYQLKNNLFPVQEGLLYTVDADGLPMAFVGARTSRAELAALQKLKEEDYSGAIQGMEAYLAQHPWNEEIWMRLARLYHSLDRPADALRAADESLKRQPQLMDALSVKVLSAIELGRLAEAHQAVDVMLAQNNVAPASYYMKALVYSKERKDKEAIDQLNLALRYSPQYDQALVLAGDILKRNGSTAQAITTYERVVQMKRAGESTLLSLAACYLQVNNRNGYRQIVTLLERDGKDRYGLEKLKIRELLTDGQTAEAGKRLQVLSENQDIELLLLRAQYALQCEERAEALRLAEEVLKQEPRNQEALQLKRSVQS